MKSILIFIFLTVFISGYSMKGNLFNNYSMNLSFKTGVIKHQAVTESINGAIIGLPTFDYVNNVAINFILPQMKSVVSFGGQLISLSNKWRVRLTEADYSTSSVRLGGTGYYNLYLTYSLFFNISKHWIIYGLLGPSINFQRISGQYHNEIYCYHNNYTKCNMFSFNRIEKNTLASQFGICLNYLYKKVHITLDFQCNIGYKVFNRSDFLLFDVNGILDSAQLYSKGNGVCILFGIAHPIITL